MLGFKLFSTKCLFLLPTFSPWLPKPMMEMGCQDTSLCLVEEADLVYQVYADECLAISFMLFPNSV